MDYCRLQKRLSNNKYIADFNELKKYRYEKVLHYTNAYFPLLTDLYNPDYVEGGGISKVQG